MKTLRYLPVLALAGWAMVAAVAAQDNPFGAFKHDASQPIEITADSLAVNQTQQVATFKGNVVVGQGTMRLTAAEMQIFYDARGDADTETGRIRLMKASGGVFLSNGTEAAEGEWAEYDVVAGVITMGGEVLLSQGDNAISGQELWIDLNDGLGEIKGRVTTVFQPARPDEDEDGTN